MRYFRYSMIPLGFFPFSILAALKGAPYALGVLLAILVIHLVWDTLAPFTAGPELEERSWPYDALLFLQAPLSVLALLVLAHVARSVAMGTLSGIFPGIDADWIPAASTLSTLPWLRWLALPEAYGIPDLLGAMLALGFELAANAIVAHELMHRKERLHIRIARLLLAFTGDAQFHLSHLYNHHLWVGTPKDAATSRRGESVYRFFLRSTVGQYRSSWNFETGRKRGWGKWSPFGNRVLSGLGVSLVCFAGICLWSGPLGALAYLYVCIYSKFLLECVNYIQHYGLVRVPHMPVLPRHSWDCSTGAASAVFFNLSRHSDHHANARKPFWELENRLESLKMERGYVHAMLMALIPAAWFRHTAPRLARWDRELASAEELDLLGKRLTVEVRT